MIILEGAFWQQEKENEMSTCVIVVARWYLVCECVNKNKKNPHYPHPPGDNDLFLRVGKQIWGVRISVTYFSVYFAALVMKNHKLLVELMSHVKNVQRQLQSVQVRMQGHEGGNRVEAALPEDFRLPLERQSAVNDLEEFLDSPANEKLLVSLNWTKGTSNLFHKRPPTYFFEVQLHGQHQDTEALLHLLHVWHRWGIFLSLFFNRISHLYPTAAYFLVISFCLVHF